ncbi:naked cuticle-like protein 1 [Patagioenas fasciata monilis]|uniref:Protein naked cuticle homolog n=1 Tax=Patagioenas fasciata monilis TaxID=372326 RepID=A0A1V4K3C0_PATFA|nr:naked cuticle-like protein 1 [Patagioenas fasciata monilis]
MGLVLMENIKAYVNMDLSGEGYRDTIGDEHIHLEVALPPEKTDGVCSGDEKKAEKESDTRTGSKKQLKFEELQCDVSVEEDNRQEWTFTLYDFDNNGRVTREDITSLLHTIYEVVDASVNHSPSSSKTLRVKLTVAPDGSQKKRSILLNHTGDGAFSLSKSDSKAVPPFSGQSELSQYHQSENNPEQSGCYRHCVDENIERRNHYLDLAGIENYTSKFGPGSPPAAQKHDPPSRVVNQTRSRSHEPETFHAHHRKSQVVDPSHIHLAESSYAKIAEIQQRLRNQDSNKHFVSRDREPFYNLWLLLSASAECQQKKRQTESPVLKQSDAPGLLPNARKSSVGWLTAHNPAARDTTHLVILLEKGHLWECWKAPAAAALQVPCCANCPSQRKIFLSVTDKRCQEQAKRLLKPGLCLQQPKQGENILSTKQLLVFFSKEIKIPFIFSKADDVEGAETDQRLKGKKKGLAVTTIFFRDRCGISGMPWTVLRP